MIKMRSWSESCIQEGTIQTHVGLASLKQHSWVSFKADQHLCGSQLAGSHL